MNLSNIICLFEVLNIFITVIESKRQNYIFHKIGIYKDFAKTSKLLKSKFPFHYQCLVLLANIFTQMLI